MKLTISEYLDAARQIEGRAGPLRGVSARVLSTFTADVLKPYLIVEGANRGLLLDLTFGPFNQLEQQVLNPEGLLYKGKPDVFIIAIRLEELAPSLIADFVKLGPAEIEAGLSAVVERMKALVDEIRNRSPAKIILWNLVEPRAAIAGLAGPLLELAPASAVNQLNRALSGISRTRPDVFVFDCARLALQVGLDSWYDQRMFHLGRVPFSSTAQMAIAKLMARTIRAALLPPAKCLVLDLDDTLWGGIVGEDGPGGIHLGESYPGNVFKEFQRYLRSLAQRGFLLAIASKNNEADAWAVIDDHPDMVLRRDDFAAVRINWEDKATSLRAIARDLNIGTDALVFFDDNPVERDWVRSQLPEVHVVDVPDKPLLYIDALETSGWFDQLVIVADDLRKTEQYREQRHRDQLQARTRSLDEFLRELDTSATIGAVTRDSLARFAQLLAKTNQFNLTSRRHSAAEIETMTARGGLALWLRAKDRFGDHGLVGAAIAMPEGDGTWRVDTFLLSCRVIGRRIETAFLASIAGMVRCAGGKLLVGEHIPTGKNDMVAAFFPDHGFTSEGGRWLFDLSTGIIPEPDCVRVTVNEEGMVGK
jgi:FkbH-like protein